MLAHDHDDSSSLFLYLLMLAVFTFRSIGADQLEPCWTGQHRELNNMCDLA